METASFFNKFILTCEIQILMRNLIANCERNMSFVRICVNVIKNIQIPILRSDVGFKPVSR